jgi:hypothetical protein
MKSPPPLMGEDEGGRRLRLRPRGAHAPEGEPLARRGVITRSIPPHPLAALRAWRSGNPLPPGERVGHSSPQQSWGGILAHFDKARAAPNFKTQIIAPDFGIVEFGSHLTFEL